MEAPMGVFFTGHRPMSLWGVHHFNHSKEVLAKYELQVRSLTGLVSEFARLGFDSFITGGALGLDQMAARIVADLRDTHFPNIMLTIAKPFPSQDAVWPPYAKEVFQSLCKRANDVVNVCDDPYEPYKMQVRNQWMVDHARVGIAMWNGNNGGTANCVNYAQKQGKPMVIIHPQTLAMTRINC